MPGVGADVVPFSGFSRGEYGLAASYDIGWRVLRQHLIYAGFFTGRDVQRSLHASLYPRSGLVDITPTGVPNGPILGFVWTDVPNRDLCFVVGTAVYDAPSVAGGAATVYAGAFAVTPTSPVAMVATAGGLVYATVAGDKTYKIDQNARTVTALASSPGGTCIAVYQNKLVVANVTGHQNRLFFSGNTSALPASLNDFTLWDPLNFVDVGDGWGINALQAQKLALVVAKQRSWWLWTGVPGVNDVLRPLNQNGPWVQAASHMAMSGDNVIWFVDFNKDTPNAFTGAKFVEEDLLALNAGVYAFTGLPPTFAVVRGYRNADILVCAVTTPGGPMKAAFLRDGAWTFHTFSPPGGFAGAFVTGRDGHSAGVRMSNGGGIGVAAKFYAWVTNRDRPPISGQPLEAPGDAGGATLTPTFTLPEYWLRAGEQLTGRAVIVDFVRWNDGWGPSNHFDVQLQALDTYGDPTAGPGPAGTVLTRTFDSPAAGAGVLGASKQGRMQFSFEGEMGNGWQVTIANLRGCEIKKVQVREQTSPLRGT